MTRSFRILIVDDQLRARQSLKALLATKFPQAEIAEATNGVEAFQATNEFQPKVVLMDVLMPQMDGLTCTRLIKSTTPRIQVVVLTMYPDYRASALGAGADAFVSKGQPPDQLLELLETLANSTAGEEL